MLLCAFSLTLFTGCTITPGYVQAPAVRVGTPVNVYPASRQEYQYRDRDEEHEHGHRHGHSHDHDDD